MTTEKAMEQSRRQRPTTFPYGDDDALGTCCVATRPEYSRTWVHSNPRLAHGLSQQKRQRKPQYEMESSLPGVAALLSRSTASAINQTMGADRNLSFHRPHEDSAVYRTHSGEDEYRGLHSTTETILATDPQIRDRSSRFHSPGAARRLGDSGGADILARGRRVFMQDRTPPRADRHEQANRGYRERAEPRSSSSFVQPPLKRNNQLLNHHRHLLERHPHDQVQRRHFTHQQHVVTQRNLDIGSFAEDPKPRKRRYPVEGATPYDHGTGPRLTTNSRLPAILASSPTNAELPRFPHHHGQMQPTTSLPVGPVSTSVASASDTPEASISATETKSSRYLREMDRHVILSRIARGEKQSALAKEFHVSRAAICNLNKHRDEVLSRKDTENPLAKHPKKPRLATRVPWSAVPASQPAQRYPSLQQANSVKPELFHSYHTMIGGQMTSTTSSLEVQTRGSEPVEPASRSAAISFSTSKYDPPRLHKLQSRSIALMLTMARARNASVTDFRRYSDRLMRLVIEHAMALAPMESVLNISSDTESSGGYSSVHPPCGIAIHPSGVPMFDIFRSMEPAQPAGVVHVSSTTHTNPPGATRRKLSLSAQTLLPASLNNYNVFVFDVALQDRQSLGLVVETLRLLLRERGACEKRLWVVALSISSQSITSLQSLFPELQIVTVTVTENPPGSGKVAAASMEDGSVQARGLDGAC